MAAATACLKWVDVLENQFDKSWVDMDLLFNEIDEDEEIQIGVLCRKHASSLASCFSQLVHKATVIFQTNAKLEAQLVNLREEIVQYEKTQSKLMKEKNYLTHALVTSLADNHKLRHPDQTAGTTSPVNADEQTEPTPPSPSNQTPSQQHFMEEIQENLNRSVGGESCDSNTVKELQAENHQLRMEIVELESELVGARLDNVYLDKELAGRIQQIQILASGTPTGVKERLWTQIEGEMCLQRSKTIAQICKSKQALRTKRLETSLEAEKQSPTSSPNSREDETRLESEAVLSEANGDLTDELSYSKGKQVSVLKNFTDDLGMAIIGGKEHNLPIIISEVFPNSAVHRSNKINAGDVILSVNEQDFSSVSHEEAVTFLSSLRGQISFKLLASDTVCEDDPSNLDFRFYRIFDSDHHLLGSPSPDALHRADNNVRKAPAQHPGRAVGLEGRAAAALNAVTSSPGKCSNGGGGGGKVVVAVEPSEMSPVHQIHPINFASRTPSREEMPRDTKKGGKIGGKIQDGGAQLPEKETSSSVVELREEDGSVAHV